MDIAPIEVCAPTTFEKAAEVRPNCSSARQYPTSPAPAPPYSSGNGRPKSPSVPVSASTSSGMRSDSSTCRSSGTSRVSTKSRTVRARSCSSSGMSKSTCLPFARNDTPRSSRSGRLRLREMDGGHAEREALEPDAGEARLSQHRGEPVRVDERLDRGGQVPIGLDARAERQGDQRRDSAEIEEVEGAQARAGRQGELEHHGTATRPEDAPHLGDTPGKVSEVPDGEAGHDAGERGVRERKRLRAAGHDLERHIAGALAGAR